MGLEFKCPNCGDLIFVQYLKPGEKAQCRSCRKSVEVPTDAKELDSPSVVKSTHVLENVQSGVVTAQPKFRAAAVFGKTIVVIGWIVILLSVVASIVSLALQNYITSFYIFCIGLMYGTPTAALGYMLHVITSIENNSDKSAQVLEMLLRYAKKGNSA